MRLGNPKSSRGNGSAMRHLSLSASFGLSSATRSLRIILPLITIFQSTRDGREFPRVEFRGISVIDMFSPRVVVVANGDFDCGLVVAKECGQGRGKGEQLEDEASRPDGFLSRVRRGDMFGLGGVYGDNFLLAGVPRDGATGPPSRRNLKA